MKSLWPTRLIVLTAALMLTACASVGSQTSSQDAETAQRYVEIGFRHLEFDNRQQARRAFREAQSLDRDASGAYLGMAMVYQAEGEPELAEDYYQRALSMSDETEYRHAYAQFLFRQGRLDEAEEAFRQVTADADYANRGAAFEDRAILNLYQNDLETAKTHFDRAIQLNRMLPMPYWHMANIHLVQGNTQRALDYFEGFENLVRADVTDHTEDSLILGLRVTEAMDREETYSGLLELLEERFPDSRYLRSRNDE
ncbi:tetratricopeptide repeat protein [Natronospirillum operosum]|uniref:Tetratricopeptide repeat protein n=1 Tax=Natronospirillum operosum TaxID=2759953 RepID=A0A4Z0WBA6_9GAMM|nr:tetratricopeptide repeat protein [Natronospirillum operosum]TGG90386.1 tetratricopeptide repeat protein [Natronospirillum operosum]